MNEKSRAKRLKRVRAQRLLQEKARIKKRQAENLAAKTQRKFSRLMNKMNGVTIRNENLRNPEPSFILDGLTESAVLDGAGDERGSVEESASVSSGS